MADSYTFKEFRRTLSGCSENKEKQQQLLEYLQTDAVLFNQYFDRVLLQNSVEERIKALEAIHAAENELLNN